MRIAASERTYCVAFALLLIGCAESENNQPGYFSYPTPLGAAGCGGSTKDGQAGRTDGEKTQSGYRYNVRTPSNYNANFAHPLLVVYAPAGKHAEENERFTALTRIATSAGFIVAYADYARIAIPVIEELSTIPGLIADRWCVDESKTYLTGHSDGGTAALAIAIMEKTKHIPAALAPSAAGFTKADIEAFKCRTPIPIIIMHSANDTLFPGFGAAIARWWAACNQCAEQPPIADDTNCLAYQQCKTGAPVLYCEGAGTHREWPALNQTLVGFLSAIANTTESLNRGG